MIFLIYMILLVLICVLYFADKQQDTNCKLAANEEIQANENQHIYFL